FFQAEDGIRYFHVTGVQTCALPISDRNYPNRLRMQDRLRLTFLGCGSSPGVPRITGDWGNCDPSNPKNRRMRCAAMAERISANGGVTRVVIDTGPDFRDQML